MDPEILLKLDARQLALLEFVKEQHGDQKRKYTNEPYWNHPLAVAKIAYGYCPYPGVIEIALCHDVVEDKCCTFDELFDFLINYYEIEQSNEIMNGVIALTDIYTPESCPDWNRNKRKKCEAERLANIKPMYQTIKYCDLMHNTTSIVENDIEFAKVYLTEKQYLLEKMNRGDWNAYADAVSLWKKSMDSLYKSL